MRYVALGVSTCLLGSVLFGRFFSVCFISIYQSNFPVVLYIALFCFGLFYWKFTLSL